MALYFMPLFAFPYPHFLGKSPKFLNDLIADKNSSSGLYNFVSDAYDKLAEKDKDEWKARIEAIDALVGNTDICFEEFNDLYDDGMDDE